MAKRAGFASQGRQSDRASPDTIGRRLKFAIGRRPAQGRKRGLRLFQHDMQARSDARIAAGAAAIPGVSLDSISAYLGDKTTPSVDFLTEAAALLGVRREWLTWGDGAPTEAEAEIDKAVKRSHAEAVHPVVRVFRSGLLRDVLPGAGRDLAEVMLLRLWAPMREALQERALLSGKNADDDQLEIGAAERIDKALRAPLEALGPFRSRIWPEDYIIAISEPLRVLAEREANWIRESRASEQRVAPLQGLSEWDNADEGLSEETESKAKRKGATRRKSNQKRTRR